MITNAIMKKQIFIIHGGTTFQDRMDFLYFLRTRPISIEKRKKWDEDYLDKELGNKFQIIRPRMPNQDNAKYEEWRIHFERFFPYLKSNIILIGKSLGGIFLAKYLSENKFPKKILSTYLIAPPFNGNLRGEGLHGGFEKLPDDLSLLEKQSKNLYFMYSKDDPIVTLYHANRYKAKLDKAKFIIFKSKNGHFFIEEFPEIVSMIKKDVKL